MLNNLLHQYQAGDLNIFQVLQHVTDTEYRLDRSGQFKNVLLTFDNEMYCTEGSTDATMETVNDVYQMKLDFMLNGIRRTAPEEVVK